MEEQGDHTTTLTRMLIHRCSRRNHSLLLRVHEHSSRQWRGYCLPQRLLYCRQRANQIYLFESFSTCQSMSVRRLLYDVYMHNLWTGSRRRKRSITSGSGSGRISSSALYGWALMSSIHDIRAAAAACYSRYLCERACPSRCGSTRPKKSRSLSCKHTTHRRRSHLHISRGRFSLSTSPSSSSTSHFGSRLSSSSG